MKKYAYLVLSLLSLTFLSTPAWAGLKEDIDQMSPEDAKAILAKLQEKAQKAENKTESGIKFGLYYPGLADLNNFLAAQGPGRLASGLSLTGGVIKHNFTPEIQGGISFMSGSTGSGTKTGGNVYLSQVNLSMSELTAAYRFPSWPFQPFIEVGVGSYSGWFQVQKTPFGGSTTIHQWSGSTIGDRVGAGIRYVNTDFFGLSFVADIDADYIFAKISSVSEGNVTDPAAPGLDLSGWMFRLGGQISF